MSYTVKVFVTRCGMDEHGRCLMLQLFINNRAGMGKIFEKKEEKREKSGKATCTKR